jgi:hypothetical protein
LPWFKCRYRNCSYIVMLEKKGEEGERERER